MAPDPYGRSLYVQTLLQPRQVTSPLTLVLRRVTHHAWTYFRTSLPESLSFWGLRQSAIDNVAWGVVAALAGVPGLFVLWKRWRVVLVFMGSYAALLLAWAFALPRFVSPFVPLVLVAFGAGAVLVSRRLATPGRTAILALTASGFVAGSIQRDVPLVMSGLACDRAHAAESPSCLPEDKRGYLHLAAFVRATIPADAIFFTSKEAGFYLHSGRRSIREADMRPPVPDSLGSWLRGMHVSYAVVTPIGQNAATHNRLIARDCQQFALVRKFEGGAVLLRVREDGPSAANSDACAAVSAWLNVVPKASEDM
jgi:hypothetical protein